MYAQHGIAKSQKLDSMIIENTIVASADMQRNSGLELDLSDDIRISVPPHEVFASYDAIMFSSMIRPLVTPSTKVGLSVKIDDRAHPAKFVSPIVSLSAVHYTPGELLDQGGWISQIPVSRLSPEIRVELPQTGNKGDGEVICAYEDLSERMWVPIKACPDQTRPGVVACCTPHLSSFALMTHDYITEHGAHKEAPG